jgi:micrococcal nuclease
MLIKPTILFLVLVFTARSPACAPSRRLVQQEPRCIVSQVVDGDTFHCGDGRKVRLIGIDSPERRQKPFGGSAGQALAGMLPPGTAVRLEYDLSAIDRYGRVLAYAWVGPKFVNEAMVREGWAVLYTVPPNVKYADRFGLAQNEARARGTGLWAQNGFACLPRDYRRGVCVK